MSHQNQTGKGNIRRAIHLDCLHLIKSYSKLNDPTFKRFCYEWKKIKFYNIYSIIMSDTDMLHTTIEIFYICKKILSQNCDDLERFGAMYLLYMVYFQQPAKNFIKIECTVKTFKLIKKFVQSVNNKQVQFLLLKLISRNAFRFVENEIYYGLEKILNKSHDYSEISYNEFSTKAIFKTELLNLTHETAGNLVALKLLENNYNEVKKSINTEIQESGEKLDLTNIFSELSAGMESITKLLDCSTSKEILGDNEDKTENTIESKRLMIKNNASMKLVESRNKNIDESNIDESQTKTDVPTSLQNNAENRKKYKKFANRFDEITSLLTEGLPSDIVKEFGEGSKKSRKVKKLTE